MTKASQKKQKKSPDNNNTSNSNDQIAKQISAPKMKRSRKGSPRDSSSQRSSIYRGVTRHKWTGRYEAHLWDKDCWNKAQKKKGRQVYLGAYDDEASAAHAYDLAALKYWGKETLLNFALTNYENEMKEMEGLSREEYIGTLRRKSSGFSRGVSKYRGVARHHHNGRWEARIGRVLGNKYLYLGTYATQEEAASAYDMAAIEYRGLNAVTNFDLSRYVSYLKPQNASSCLDQSSPETLSCITQVNGNDINIGVNEGTESTGDDFLEHNFDQKADINMDEALLGELFDLEGWSFSGCSHENQNATLLEAQSSEKIINKDEDFFSDLSSFLCDFDILQEDASNQLVGKEVGR